MYGAIAYIKLLTVIAILSLCKHHFHRMGERDHTFSYMLVYAILSTKRIQQNKVHIFLSCHLYEIFHWIGSTIYCHIIIIYASLLQLPNIGMVTKTYTIQVSPIDYLQNRINFWQPMIKSMLSNLHWRFAVWIRHEWPWRLVRCRNGTVGLHQGSPVRIHVSQQHHHI